MGFATAFLSFATLLIVAITLALIMRLVKEGPGSVLIQRFKIANIPDHLSARRELIYIYAEMRWRQWSQPWLMMDDRGLYLVQPKYIEIFLPSLHIPWQDIIAIHRRQHRLGELISLEIKELGEVVGLEPQNEAAIKTYTHLELS